METCCFDGGEHDMKHRRLVEFTTLLHRDNCLPAWEAWEFARCIANGSLELESVTLRLNTQISDAGDLETFCAMCNGLSSRV